MNDTLKKALNQIENIKEELEKFKEQSRKTKELPKDTLVRLKKQKGRIVTTFKSPDDTLSFSLITDDFLYLVQKINFIAERIKKKKT